ncbi:hypothetical protein EDB83DRAFT_2317341 [Lactarius deliciosus]|nr:hypothetical protein EDB83DRAFT_2317341 [Lactarius deliciosus]
MVGDEDDARPLSGGSGEARSCHASAPEEAGDRAGVPRLRAGRGLPTRSSLRLWAAARLSAYAVATVAPQMCYFSGFWKNTGPVEAALAVGGKPYTTSLDGGLYQHYFWLREVHMGADLASVST